jgi:hypothetical protein
MSQITQKGATGALALQANGTFQSSSDANLATLVGTRYDLSDGREVILVSTGSSTTTTSGQLYQDAAIVANHANMAIASIVAYSANGNVPASFIATLGNTAITANQYAGGFAVVNAGTGKGQTLRIASNSAAAGSGTTAIVLEDAPNVALSASDSKVSLIPAHGASVIVMPTTPTNVPVGVALYPIAAGSYGFLVTRGIVSALSDVTVATVGQAISPSVTTAGAVTLASGTNATVTSIIGNTLQTAVSAESRAVFLNSL